MQIEIYDCTLREGEQAAEASFSQEDRVKLFEMLDDFGADYVELGWPVSQQVLESFALCMKIRKKAKIVAFGSTSIVENPGDDKNILSILASKADYACIFGKTWKEHVEKQLHITAEENLKRISNSVEFLRANGMKVFYDAEHFFDGYKDNKKYALETLMAAAKAGAERLILCDTNGGTLPEEVNEIVNETKKSLEEREIKTELGVHFHNDCGLALANSIVSLPYVKQIQGTINGTGERIGNLNFSEFLPVYIKKLARNHNVKLEKLKELNGAAYKLSGLEIPEIRPFIGDTAFAHKGGVHIDAHNKGASYQHEEPENFGNKRNILLTTLGGGAGVISAAEQFGYKLDKKNSDVQEKAARLFLELGEIERKGYRIAAIPAEQYLLIEKYFGNLKDFFEIESWKVETGKENGKETSKLYVRCNLNKIIKEENTAADGGPVDLIYKTIKKILAKDYPDAENLQLLDFHVSIARSKKEESIVRVLITFQNEEKFQTVGVDSNIIQSAIEAIEKGFRYYLNIKKSLS